MPRAQLRPSVPTEHRWTLWICSDCGARAEWKGYRVFCGRCGSHEREQVMLVREADLLKAAKAARKAYLLIQEGRLDEARVKLAGIAYGYVPAGGSNGT